ncbi:UvrD-like Helicase [Macleaya cordata]|uniref:UvrD-like Helicase n=1 Tax=Macleaya cordata TaxID=56857 RepID=A0A200Q9C4_MACCD|nr:UvrD-like Helicase [Macleaya cordata]
MEVISGAPYAEVISLEESKPHGSLLYHLKIDSWRNSCSESGKEPYSPKRSDLFVLTDAVPEVVSDLERFGRTWTFALVTKFVEDSNAAADDDTSSYFKVQTSKAIEVKEGMRNSLFAVFLTNMTTNTRIWTALHMFRNLEIIKEVLCPNSVVEENCHLCSPHINSIWAQKVDGKLLLALNESQTAAVLGSIVAVQCNHRSSAKLVWGPPGTGKTKTVSILLYTLLRMNCRTLASAPTNIAVAEVAMRVLKLVKEPYIKDLKQKSFCSLGDLLLFGNRNRLEVFDDLEEIYLDYRVDRLVECFSPLTGWKKCFKSMMDFLEECVSQYHLFLENESIKEADAKTENEATPGEHISFLDFIRNRYTVTALPLKTCINVLCTHLPKRFILEHNFENMVYLLDLLESFGSLLYQNGVVDKELEELFAYPELDCSKDKHGSEAFLCSTLATLYKMRIEYIDVLRSLSHSLDDRLPNFRSRVLVREFCFQSASLFFCTVSSSYSLHMVEMEPLNLLVIDEAAQLKECESLIPLQLGGIRHAILIGDECQLPALVNSKVSEEAGFGRSLFERLSSLGHSKDLLNMQYRMHPKISSFPNAKFYLNQILDAPNVHCKSYGRHYLPGPMFGPYSFINISNGREEIDGVGPSRKNMVEVAVIMRIVRNLFKAWDSSRQKLTVGIISPYAAQVAAIEEKLGEKYEKLEDFTLRVKSIDGFQGGEEDIIIISTVRSNSGGSIGFLSNPQRTNVALTRARHCLWILGNDRTLYNSGSCWASLVRDAKDRQCFFNADEDKELAKAILEAKKELDQLDDLLNGDSILFKSARWKVLFSDNFRKSFGKLKSLQTQKSVINLLLKLSNGWRPKKIKVESVCGSSTQLVKQYKVGGLYIISTVDIAKHSRYTQVLKIWDVLPLEEIPKLLKRLDSIFSMYTDDFLSRCMLKHIEGDLEVPMIWGVGVDIVRYKNTNSTELVSGSSTGVSDGRSYVENSKVRDSLLLMKFYSLSSGVVSHLLSGSDGRELDLPFEVTDQESEIILFPRSTFILGRSGTGKTTVLTMKLFQKEQQHYLSSEGLSEVKSDNSVCSPTKNLMREGLKKTKGTILRQMFVTVSPKLCSAVKNQISNLKSFICGGKSSAEHNSIDMHDMDDTIDFRDIPDRFTDIPPESYPLVITFQKFLMMLDGSMENSYFDRFNDIRELSQGATGNSRTFALHALIRSKEINYDRFSSFYWPHFNSQLTKKLDSSTVFIEIISHIKGGLIAGRVPDGKLGREDYLLLSEGRVSSLNNERREMVYDIFLDYEKKKLLNGEFDLADLVIDLHRRLKNGSYEGEEMDFVYIDEVQDLTMRQIGLFKYICRNYMEGFVFSGDTAQTIARGIDFRFQDIRSLFYNEFILESRGDGKEKAKEKDQTRISDIFHLNQNFRTHAGVLKLSQSVIELLYHFFPLSVDILSPETSLIYGESPVLLESANDENAIITIFGNSGGNIGRSMIGFGAEQVILVRDDSVRKEIAKHIGKQALVLTIVECKGLEFQDVLLYNFFGSSPLKNHWRVLYGYMKEQNLLDSEHKSFPRFSKAKHKILCSELKQLYVAITRTRQRLWICENIEEFSKPIFDYWKKLCLVQVRELDESLAQAMQVASSKEEWSSRGIKLFNEGYFEMATMCFERAGDSYREKWAKASGLRAAANRMHGSNSELAWVALIEAAEIYETIGKAESAAKCFFELKEFKRAGMLYLEKCGEARLEDAGDCFALAGCWSTAAEVYSRANCFSKCLAVCTNGNLFDMGLHLIEYWKESANADVDIAKSQELNEMKQGFLERCAVHYHELNDTNNMMKFVRTFNSMDCRRTFLRSRDYLDELMFLEVESENFMEAAAIARIKGDLLFEADMLEKAGLYEDASVIILKYVLVNSLWAYGSKGWPLKKFTNKEELLTKAKLMVKYQDLFYEVVCMEASVLSSKDSSLSQMGDCLSASQRLKNIQAEIISSWKILDSHLDIACPKYEWEDYLVLNPMKHAESSISQNRVSIDTLIYFWNLWKEKIVDILNYLSSLGTQHEKDYKIYEEFCLGFLGVSKQEHNQNSIYLLLNTDAYWRKEVDDRSLQRNGNLYSMDIQQFVSDARSYWVSQVLRVGMDVLEKLEALHKFSVRSSFSMFCQGTIVLHIFEVTKWLMDSQILDKKLPWALQKYLSSSKDHFFEILCPINWKLSMMENMMALRVTELSKNLVKEVIIGNMSSKGRLSHGQIGRVAMLIFVSGNLTDELCQVIAHRFDLNPEWKCFIEQLKENFDSGFVPVSLVGNFQIALQDTFNANWRKEFDYMSPRCFVYLLDRLLFLVSSWQAFFFTTKSSLIETLSCENWKQNSSTLSRNDLRVFLARFHDFIAGMIDQILSSRKEVMEWLEKTDIAAKKDFPLLVLRLVIFVCLIHLNSGQHSGLLFNLLGRNDINSLLPRAFHEILKRRKQRFDLLLAKALRTIENPLVILCSGNKQPNFICTDALVIDMDLIRCREDVLAVLFPKNPKCAIKDEIETKSACDVSVSSCSNDHDSNIELVPSSDKPDDGSQSLENENEKENGYEDCDLQQIYKQFWNTFCVSNLETQEKNGKTNFASWKLQFKLDVEDFIRVLDAGVTKLNKNSPGDDDWSLSRETETMLGELKQLSTALSVRSVLLYIWCVYIMS